MLCVHRAFTAASVEAEEGKQTHEITEREAQGEGKTKQEEVECGFEEKQNEVWTIDTDTFILFKRDAEGVSAVSHQCVSTEPRLGESWSQLRESCTDSFTLPKPTQVKVK